MGPGGIATIIAACSLLVIAVAISYAVVRIGKLIDEAKISLKTVTDETKPLIEEVTTTVSLVNGPLESFNRITKNVEDVTNKATDVASSFLDKGGPAVKAVSIQLGLERRHPILQGCELGAQVGVRAAGEVAAQLDLVPVTELSAGRAAATALRSPASARRLRTSA